MAERMPSTPVHCAASAARVECCPSLKRALVFAIERHRVGVEIGLPGCKGKHRIEHTDHARELLFLHAAVLDAMEPYSADLAGGVEPPQVLLLHANSLNQAWYPAIHALYLERGYRFVTLEEAMTDPIYRRPDRWVRANGVSWLHRWAVTEGRPIMPEPDTPQWVVDVAEGRTPAG